MMETMVAPPRVKGLPLIGNAIDFMNDPLQFLVYHSRHTGRVFEMQIGSRTMTVVWHPSDVKQVLLENAKNYGKSEGYKAVQRMLGNGLLNSEGDFWLRQRKLIQPAFHLSKIAGMTNLMVATCGNILQRWEQKPQGEIIDLSAELMRITLEIVTNALFSTDVSQNVQQVYDHMGVLLEYAYYRIVSPVKLPEYVPTPGELRFRKARREFDDLIYGIIAKRKQQPCHYNDLLDMLLASIDEDTNTGMTEEQLRDEIITLFMAGHETSANALAWCFYLLTQSPETTARIREEIARVTGGQPVHFEHLGELKFVNQVIQETLRLYPPAWVIGRKSLHGDTIAGYHVPANRTVVVSPYATHRHPDLWENPDQFNPDRFASEEVKKMTQPGKFQYIPFGGGARMCIGYNFALLEMQLVLAMILPHYSLELPQGTKVQTEPLITLRPKNGLKMNIRRL
ncbi:cytochrome P450 [Rhodoflexus caldus]|uniref:cytochrome P450 n=1 Tax=Rhodoflexus caldus TaxID=2891236 RepID=UPI002029BA63|nr:cytochrome P450 [Rhodoflexus caldus]